MLARSPEELLEFERLDREHPWPGGGLEEIPRFLEFEESQVGGWSGLVAAVHGCWWQGGRVRGCVGALQAPLWWLGSWHRPAMCCTCGLGAGPCV